MDYLSPMINILIPRYSELDQMVECLTRVLALCDSETEEHTRRMTAMTLSLACAIEIPHAELLYIHCGAMLHDIGKSVSQILFCPRSIGSCLNLLAENERLALKTCR